jgi:hypothetical protein
MVNKIFVYIFMVLLSSSLHADFANSDNFVTANIDEYHTYENQPLNGTITVTHDQNNAVDISSFLLDNKPIKVEFAQDVKISAGSSLVISYYNFQLPAKPIGLYMLPEVAVNIGGKQYHSIMSSYEVKGKDDRFSNPGNPPSASPSSQTPNQALPSTPAQQPTSSSVPKGLPSKILLKLDALVEPNKSLYPGQKTKFIYRYLYNTNISLSKEVLPLLNAEGFLKFGDIESKDYTENNMSVHEVSQMVEAIKPGTFSFGPSTIEGYAYTLDSKGKPSYSSSKLTSEIPSVTVKVLPFPDKEKPPFFNGAIGDFEFTATLDSSPNMRVGDEIRLNINISGKGDIKAAPLPDIGNQPGFVGFFRMSDLPPAGSVNGNVKHFTISMRPIVQVKEIPGIAFSFFNPASNNYATVNSKPIPITVKAAEELPSKAAVDSKAPALPKASVEVTHKTLPRPIEIQGIFSLITDDLYNKLFGTWLVLGMLPFALALLFYQFTLRDYLERIKNEVKPETSRDVYQEFLQEKKGSSRYYELLNKSLKLKLAETGFIDNPDILIDGLATTGISGEVRAFLNEIEENRFSKAGKLVPATIEARANTLMEKMDNKEIQQ